MEVLFYYRNLYELRDNILNIIKYKLLYYKFIVQGDYLMIEMCRDLNELNPKVKELAEALLKLCEKEGLNIKIGETYRSIERQDYLYAQGRTRPGNIVTNARGSSMSSYHQWRLAFDVYQNIKGAEYDSHILAKVGKLGQSLGLEWGGSWSSFSDTPHFQYTFDLSIKDLNSGKRVPQYTSSQEITTTVDVDKEYEKAVNTLLEKEIINTKDSWYPEPNFKYTVQLVEKISLELIKSDYHSQINLLNNKGIVSEVEKWGTQQYKLDDIKWLIKKAAIYLAKE